MNLEYNLYNRKPQREEQDLLERVLVDKFLEELYMVLLFLIPGVGVCLWYSR